jgi:hypothetical protein
MAPVLTKCGRSVTAVTLPLFLQSADRAPFLFFYRIQDTFFARIKFHRLHHPLATRNDRLQHHTIVFTQTRYEVIVLDLYDNYALCPIRVLDDVQDVAARDMKDDIFGGYAARGLEFFVLRVVPREVLQGEAQHIVCLLGKQAPNSPLWNTCPMSSEFDRAAHIVWVSVVLKVIERAKRKNQGSG